MSGINFKCVKCGSADHKVGEIRAAGGFWTKIFDIQSEKFSYVSCGKCSYTEFYNVRSSQLGNIFDFLTQ